MSSHLPHIENQHGQVELVQPERLDDADVYNRDLAPVPVRERRWSAFNYAALWIAFVHCLPTYMLASALVGVGMSPFGAAATVLLGNALLVVPLLLNAHAGARFGAPFAVLARAAYGTQGAHVATLIRGVVACGWFGIQAWIGGQALHVLIGSLVPAWFTVSGSAWIAFALFWLMNVFVAVRGMSWLRHVESFAAPFILVMTSMLLLWAFSRVGMRALLFGAPLRTSSLGDLVPAITATVGYWAAIAVSASDFSRYASAQREHILGQGLTLPWAMAFYAAMAAFVTQATLMVYGDALWDPMVFVAKFKSPLVTAISGATIVVTTLTVNTAANIVAPARAFSSAWPRRVSFRAGAVITAVVGVLMMPWRLLDQPSSFLFAWLLGSSGPLGAVCGVMIVDYWLVRKRMLSLGALYDPNGEYAGIRKSAAAATLIGVLTAWGGLWVPALRPLYDVAFFSGFIAAGIAHWALASTRA